MDKMEELSEHNGQNTSWRIDHDNSLSHNQVCISSVCVSD